MTWALVASTSATPGAGGGATAAINTTGANLIVVEVSEYGGGTFSDSNSNVWTTIGPYAGGSSSLFLYVCVVPTVGVGHTFSYVGGDPYPSINVLAFSGSIGSGTYDQVNHATGSSVTSQAAGSITPSVSGSLVIAALAFDAVISGQAISVGTIQEFVQQANSAHQGGAIAYYVQSAAAPINPDWTWANSSNAAAVVLSFEPGGTSVTADAVSFAEALKTNKMG